MNILAIDTSTSVASVSLQINDKIYTKNIDDTKTHSQKLLPLIAEILKENNLKSQNIDLFICGNGPGSFTGIRIGVSTIKALAQTGCNKILSISTLDCLAYNEIENYKYICSLMDARNDNAYYCIYEVNEDKTTKLISTHDAKNIDEILEEAKNINNKIVFVGSGVYTYKEKILQNSNFNISDRNSVTAENLVKIYNIYSANNVEYIKQNTFNCHGFNPIYLRPSQAERLNNMK